MYTMFNRIPQRLAISKKYLSSLSTRFITIYHNPNCGTSRNTLAMIRNSGTDPTIIEYLKQPPSKDKLQSLLQDMGMPPRKLLRTNVEPYELLGLKDDKWTDDELLDFMVAHPLLINRPIVVTPLGTRLCRPSEVVMDILPNPQMGQFVKEDGERVVDEHGARMK